eukprot:TRINITY_DN35_c0_g1_i1.p1 TRINITY_DN35_c0_g1~~TRINITY_DN35_c0_g1_i1.p1  ORF type:complete len:328 (+),score=36.19 TRINITY_DN35_c0_g1_i1:147-1130(+)
MASSARTVVALLLVLAIFDSQRLAVLAQLADNYYGTSCPQAYQIIKDETYRYYKIHGNVATSAYRNVFHDCAVNKCDGSILLDGTPGVPNERASFKNFGLRNFKWFYATKRTVEKACPGVVSCADLVALMGVYSVKILGDIDVYVKTGRKDRGITLKEDADKQLPGKDDDIDTFLNRLKELGLDTEHAVALLGGHSVGRVHCQNLVNRLYPVTSADIAPTFANFCKFRCPTQEYTGKETDPNYVRFDEYTPMGLDSYYFRNLLEKRLLLKVDSNLVSDPRTLPFVTKFAADNAYFKLKFAEAFKILLEYNAFTGPNGKVFKDCKLGI